MRSSTWIWYFDNRVTARSSPPYSRSLTGNSSLVQRIPALAMAATPISVASQSCLLQLPPPHCLLMTWVSPFQPRSAGGTGPCAWTPGASSTMASIPAMQGCRMALRVLLQQRHGPFPVRVMRAPVFIGPPIRARFEVQHRLVLSVSGDPVHDPPGDQPHKNGIGKGIARSFSAHQAGPERIGTHYPFQLTISQVAIGAIPECVGRPSHEHRIAFQLRGESYAPTVVSRGHEVAVGHAPRQWAVLVRALRVEKNAIGDDAVNGTAAERRHVLFQVQAHRVTPAARIRVVGKGNRQFHQRQWRQRRVDAP